MEKEIAKMSATNGNKMLTRQNQIASDLAYYVERGFAKSEHEMRSKCNKALYDLAEKTGKSLWDLCFSFVPRWVEQNQSTDMSKPDAVVMNIDYVLELVPLEIDWEHGPDYWEVKYKKLKSDIEKLLNKEG